MAVDCESFIKLVEILSSRPLPPLDTCPPPPLAAMTERNYEAFKKLTKEDLNAFLKANQDELTLTDAEVQTFLGAW